MTQSSPRQNDQFNLRPATPADVPQILRFIHDLAEYEREPYAVHATEDDLLRDGFGKTKRFDCLMAELNQVGHNDPRRLRPLLLQLLHLARPRRHSHRRPLRPPGTSREGNWQSAPDSRSRHRRSRGLLAPAMGCARVEHPGHRLLPADGRADAYGLAHHARCRATAPGSLERLNLSRPRGPISNQKGHVLPGKGRVIFSVVPASLAAKATGDVVPLQPAREAPFRAVQLKLVPALLRP